MTRAVGAEAVGGRALRSVAGLCRLPPPAAARAARAGFVVPGAQGGPGPGAVAVSFPGAATRLP
ncbi:hypothetical protein [Streptomyces sp. HB2AG]|uniref:hypothetical protein n=1 Tax=Streptomyces sp. HB2AG TaxID=2983400 RepID=UPI0022AAD469|nr:hypothetical protein [Streptomyces sp. HB2AG]MCZ2526547.1 hypothetical protein [Streptomyces sp. HB2AG]